MQAKSADDSDDEHDDLEDHELRAAVKESKKVRCSMPFNISWWWDRRQHMHIEELIISVQ